MNRLYWSLLCMGVWAAASAAHAQSTAPEGDTVSFVLHGSEMTIARQPDDPLRACPPACLQPALPAPGITPMGEREVMVFLRDQVSVGAALLLDARDPVSFAKGALPGAVNVPADVLVSDNPYRAEILRALGAQPIANGVMDFSAARALAVYGEGPLSDRAALALVGLIEAGYPIDKLHYYRGGVEIWQLLGLTMSGPTH